jgi:hypothetical protein
MTASSGAGAGSSTRCGLFLAKLFLAAPAVALLATTLLGALAASLAALLLAVFPAPLLGAFPAPATSAGVAPVAAPAARGFALAVRVFAPEVRLFAVAVAIAALRREVQTVNKEQIRNNDPPVNRPFTTVRAPRHGEVAAGSVYAKVRGCTQPLF